MDERAMRRAADVERLTKIDRDLCMLCQAHGPNMRGLTMSCLYPIEEVLPEAIERPEGDYYLRICKTCRAEFLKHLSAWRIDRLAWRARPKNADGAMIEINADMLTEAEFMRRIR